MKLQAVWTVLLFFLSLVIFNNTAFSDENQTIPPMTPVLELKDLPVSEREAAVRGFLSLKYYEAAMADDKTLCGDDGECIEDAVQLRKVLCIVHHCTADDRLENLLDCSEGALFNGDQNLLAALCALMRAPGPEARKKFLDAGSADPHINEADAVEAESYSLALARSGEACRKHLKEYLGPYGKNWTLRWYKNLAACGILSDETSRRKQEKNLDIWYRGEYCAYISDVGLRTACAVHRGVLPVSPEDFCPHIKNVRSYRECVNYYRWPEFN